MVQTRIKAFGYWIVVMAALLCSCSSDDDTTPQEDSNGRCLRQLILSDVSMNTRATIDPTTYAAAWATTDRPTHINLSMLPDGQYYGSLTPSAAGASTTLTGSVYCGLGDNIAVILPTLKPVMPSGGPLSFPITLSGQNGTLTNIGANYHYIYGVGTVTATDGITATGTITNTKSLLSLCKFTFTNGGNPVNVKSVQIGWGPTGSVGYPQRGTGTVSLAAPENVSVETDAPDGPLTVMLSEANAEGVVYVALFPCDSKLTFHFTVSDNDNNTYTATKTAKMLEGKYYNVPVAVN